MWCLACRADVAAELSLDSRHFRCARCGTELGTAAGALGAATPQAGDAERNARDLLARWSAENIIEPAPSARAGTSASEHARLQPPTVVEEQASRDMNRRDPSAQTDNVRRTRTDRKRRLDRKELEQGGDGDAMRPAAPPRANWGMAVGQVCAYLGIGLITCGTAVVLWGYFGGPAQYTPSGWLVTTIGQMFLFLGVVTLISNGMEQTSADVAARMEILGRRLIRIENLQRRHAVTGPHRRDKRRHEGSVSLDG
jgi:hypothetical protein